MFALLAVPAALYALHAALTGSVVVSEGPRARRVARDSEPGYFWTCIAIYAGLAAAMAFLF